MITFESHALLLTVRLEVLPTPKIASNDEHPKQSLLIIISGQKGCKQKK